MRISISIVLLLMLSFVPLCSYAQDVYMKSGMSGVYPCSGARPSCWRLVSRQSLITELKKVYARQGQDRELLIELLRASDTRIAELEKRIEELEKRAAPNQ